MTKMRAWVLITAAIFFGCSPDRANEWEIVLSELKSLNPDWNGQYEIQMRIGSSERELKLDLSNKEVTREGGVLTVQRYSAKIKDISPLSKLRSLRELVLAATQVDDIGVLKGLNLEYLDISGTNVKNIESLRGMPLHTLIISRTPVHDISVLSTVPDLDRLIMDGTKVNSLTALRGKRLEFLDISDTPVASNTLPDDVMVEYLINRVMH